MTKPVIHGVPEYDCIDCGIHVYLFCAPAVPEPALCGTCNWMREYVPGEDERERIRKIMELS